MEAAGGVRPVNSVPDGLRSAAQQMSASPINGAEPVLRKTRSMRTRPDEMLEKQEAAPRLPLKGAQQARELQSRPSKMSLFNLFSKPKVEKLRGYTESGTSHLAPPALGKSKLAGASEPDMAAVRRQELVRQASIPRPPSSKSQGASRPPKVVPKERVPPLPRDQRSAPFSPPPLFQAYPQSTKHAVLQIPVLSSDAMAHQKSRSRLSNVETTRKIFVLITSGYLLQYAYDGPSDRQPEKILELGKDSAAFACDLLPDMYFVLQVSHAVNRQGVAVPASTSLLARLGLRGNTSRRMMSNCFLTFPTADEMQSWIVALRHEIEVQGGRKTRAEEADALGGGQAQQPTSDPREEPSSSHRYQIKRHPSKVSSVTSPSDQEPPANPFKPSVKVDDDTAETATIDGIEEEASAIGLDKDAARDRATSDATSADSSATHSFEQQQLEKIRNSIRMSHASSLTTGLTSRTNSPTSFQPSEPFSKANIESAHDQPAATSAHRNAGPHVIANRRSLMPLMLGRSDTAEESTTTERASMHAYNVPQLGSPLHSPTLGQYPMQMDSLQSPQKRSTLAESAPDLRAHVDAKRRHDSKVQSPTLPGNGERPESVLGELPSPSALANKTSPTVRSSSFAPALSVENASNQHPKRRDSLMRTRSSEPRRQSAGPTTAFNLPLRINAPDQPSVRSVRRASQALDHGNVASPVPVVHTLTAKVDLTKRTTISTAHIPPRTSSTISAFEPKASRHANSRLSLFPAQPSPFPIQAPSDRIKRSPSTSTSTSSYSAQAAGGALRRPTSLQVRSSQAPFLSSVRNSTQDVPAALLRPGTTIPIRGLRPSRSSVMMHAADYSLGQDPFYEAKLASVALAAEANGESPRIALQRPPSFPVMPIATSSSSWRASRIKSGTFLDLGVPIAGLGPPAPPPSAPLPDIPTVKQSPSSSSFSEETPIGRTFLVNGSPPQLGPNAATTSS